MKSVSLALAVLVASLPAPAWAQPGNVTGEIEAAQDALSSADYTRAATITEGIVRGGLSRSDLMEAWRIRGLALFFLEKRAEAEQALFEFLKLDPDATLDAAIVPPEAISFLEEVRTRYRTDLDKYRPKAKRKLYWWLNLVPVAGQIQNGDTTKAWIFGSAEGVLLATNITTFALLRSWCDDKDVCESSDGTNRSDAARAARAINAVSGVALIGVVGYGIVDGFLGQRRISRERERSSRETMSVGVFPTPDGAFVTLGGPF
jgi:hypothetical protein